MFLRLVYAEARREELDQMHWEEGARDAFLRMQFDAQTKHYFEHYPGARFSIIESGNQSVGRLYLARWTQEIRVIDIALIPAARSQGIGSALLREIIQEAREACKTVTIHVEKQNPALTLYRCLGFHPIEDKGVYWLMEWSPANPQRAGRGPQCS
jgi:GNAT superfamily N-acetyltransferase